MPKAVATKPGWVTTITPLVIIGAGGHGRELLDIVEAVNRTAVAFDFLGFLDDGPIDHARLERRGSCVLGGVEHLARIDAQYLIGVGLPETRRRIDAYASSLPRAAASVVHPSASLGADVSMGPGTVLAAGARVTTNVRLGRHVHLNVNATVSHDCVVGDYVIVNPGASVCGNVVLGDDVIVGTGAVVIQGVTIGSGTTIGAGAAVVRDLPPGVTAVGVPAEPCVR